MAIRNVKLHRVLLVVIIIINRTEMFKQTATDLSKASPALVEQWLSSFDTVLSDCDGVLWWGPRLIPGSCEAIKRLQDVGKTVYFVTNAPSITRNELQQVAESRGYKITKDKILSVSYITAKYLHDLKFNKKAYLIGARGIAKELSDVGIEYIDSDTDEARDLNDIMANGLELDEDVGAIIVSFDTNFKYLKMLMACNYLKNPKCMFLATSFDEVYPTSNGVIVPCIGPSVRAIEVASGRTAINMGKPSVNMCKSLIDDGTIVPERTLVIGDSAKYDILFGVNCAFQTMLVESGVNKLDDVRLWQESNRDEDRNLIPDFYLPTLGDLLTVMKNLSHQKFSLNNSDENI